VSDTLALAIAALALALAAALVVWRERVKSGAAATAAFLGEVTAEVKKVSWPDQKQLKQATLVILGFVAVVSLLIGALDVVLQWLLVSLPTGRGF
jgi:preprotein translocase subunit SecE